MRLRPPPPPLPTDLHAVLSSLNEERHALLKAWFVATDAGALEKIVGWKNISQAIGMSVRFAIYHADREWDPMPVEHGPAGVIAYRFALQDWMDRETESFAGHVEREQLRKLVGAKTDVPVTKSKATPKWNPHSHVVRRQVQKPPPT